MKVEKSFHIESVTLNHPSPGRGSLTHVKLDADRRCLLATDGRACAVVPCEVEAGDTSGYLTGEALRAARRVGGKREPVMQLLPNGKLEVPGAGVAFERPTEEILGHFPDIDQVIPQMKPGDEDTITIGIDAQLLATVSASIGCHGGNGGGIRLVARVSDRLGRMLVPPHDDRKGTVLGLIMPQRFD